MSTLRLPLLGFFVGLTLTALARDGLSPRDARSLRTYFRDQASEVTFDDPALAAWHQAVRVESAESIPPTLEATFALVNGGKLSSEQGRAVLAQLEPMLSRPVSPETTAWITEWKLSRAQAQLSALQPLAVAEQDLLFQHTARRRQPLLVRELARTQSGMPATLKTYWAQLTVLPPAELLSHLLLVELYGPSFRSMETYLAGLSTVRPKGLSPQVCEIVEQRIALERQWQSSEVPGEHSLSDYLRSWQQWTEVHGRLLSAAKQLPIPFDGILLAFADQKLSTNWNHLVIVYLAEVVMAKSGAPGISRLLEDYGVPPSQFVAYILNPSNLWVLNQVSDTALAPVGEWLLTQPALPLNEREGLQQVLTHLGQAHAYAAIIALGQKARNQLATPWLDEWGQYAMLRGYISSGNYHDAQALVGQMARNGGCREFSPAAWLRAAIAAEYLAGDYKATYPACWEQFALYPADADRAFLADLAIHEGDGYAGAFLRRLK